MKRKMFVMASFCALALMTGLAARAADEPAKVEGKWQISMEGRQGAGPGQTLMLKQDGGKITGTLAGPRGETSVEGTVKGNEVRFTAKRETPRGEMTFAYKGTVDGDTMKGTVQIGENSRDWSAKREKEEPKD